MPRRLKIRAVCTSESSSNTKYYQQGIEVRGGDFFYDGSSIEEWLNVQDKRSGDSGDYTCYTQKISTPYPKSVIDALKTDEITLKIKMDIAHSDLLRIHIIMDEDF